MKSLLTLLAVVSTLHIHAQYADKEFYLWDANNNPVSDQKQAKFFTVVNKISDTCWQWDTYNMFGPLVASEHFKDHDGKMQHGKASYYQSTGYVDSAGSIWNGLAEGDWYYYNDTGRAIFQKKFVQGKIEKIKDLVKEENEKKLLAKEDESNKRDEKESEFPGGAKGWQRYLLKNLKYPERALNSSITGKVSVLFVVNKEGTTEEISIFRSVEFSLDREAEYMISHSPKWIPAYQDGRIVKSYKIQPIVFGLQ
jgi:periplasmic protein TonB